MFNGPDHFFERPAYRYVEFIQGLRIPIQHTSQEFFYNLNQVVAPTRRPWINHAHSHPEPFERGRSATHFIEVIQLRSPLRLPSHSADPHTVTDLLDSSSGLGVQPMDELLEWWDSFLNGQITIRLGARRGDT